MKSNAPETDFGGHWLRAFIGVVVAAALAVIVGVVLQMKADDTPVIDSINASAASIPVVTQIEYLSVREGMSYSRVVEIIGDPGDETASSVVEEVPGVMERVEFKGYSWINEDGSNMGAMFQNDELTTKAQFGLQ